MNFSLNAVHFWFISTSKQCYVCDFIPWTLDLEEGLESMKNTMMMISNKQNLKSNLDMKAFLV